ncbi:unnamed protein product [Lymnaea stagnalis]|uniref:CUB domain-containing protein n=1 Tax=Lymnaea stagnalis TaxID=6523 RepID=A0AAV2HTC4_LYMST
METHICFVFTLCVLLAGQASANECGSSIIANASGNITQPSKPQALPCGINITANATVFFQVENLVLLGSDTLVIYDVLNASAKEPIASYKAGDIAPFPVVAALQKNITIIFTAGVNSTSNWTLNYSLDCKVDISNDWSHKVDSPKFLATPGKSFRCIYDIACNLPSDRIAALSFLSLSVFNNSELSLSSGINNASFTNTSNGEDFFAEGIKPVKLDFQVDTAQAQSFSIFVEPVVNDCSGKVAIKKTFEVPKNFSNPGVSYVCRWVVISSLARITAKINSLQISNGYDLLTFTDGGSSRAAISKSWSSGINESLFLSSGSKAVISLQLGDFSGARSLNLSLLAADGGGPISSQGELSVDDKQEDLVTYYQLNASPGQLVKVNISDRTINETSVVFYDGLQPTDPVLVSLKSGIPNLKIVIGGSSVLVAVTRVSKANVFKAAFSSLAPGCDQLATGNSGSWNYNSNVVGVCRYTVNPNTNTDGQIILYLDSLTLRAGESLKVLSGVDSSTVIAQFEVPAGETAAQEFNLLQVHGTAREGISVDLARNTAETLPSKTSVRYEVVSSVCGGVLKSKGDLTTPNHPNVYPINAKCAWTINDAKADQLILLTFQSLNLAPGHSLKVIEDDTVVAGYGGQVTPTADLLVKATNVTKIEFNSPTEGNSSQVGSGAKVSYLRPTCGANLTSIFSNNVPVPSSLPDNSLCVWSIDVKNTTDKTNSTNIIRFNITTLEKNTTIIKQSLKIFDGESLKNKSLEFSLNQVGYSRGDRLIIKLELTQALPGGFNISFETKTCNSTEKCENGICMRSEWLCNGKNDCGDNTDELNCHGGPTPAPPTTQKPQEADYSGWVKSGWIPACLFIGILIGLVLYFVVPKLYRHIRGRGGNYSRMGDDRPVVT